MIINRIIVVFSSFLAIGSTLMWSHKSLLEVYEHANPENHLVENFVERYYEKQKAVKVIEWNNYRCNWLLKVIFAQKSVLTVNPEIVENVNPPVFKQNFGFFASTEQFDEHFLSFLNKCGSGPWIIFVEREFHREMLKVAWKKFQLIHVVVFTSITDVEYYNPFTAIYHKDSLVNVTSIHHSIQSINQRVRNLHGNKLSVYLNHIAQSNANPVFDKKGLLKRFTGYDGEILEGIRKSMNFKVDFKLISYDKNATYDEFLLEFNKKLHDRHFDLLATHLPINYSSMKNIFPLDYIKAININGAFRAQHEMFIVNFLYGFADIPSTLLLYGSVISLSVTFFIATKVWKIRTSWLKVYLELTGMAFGVGQNIEKYSATSLRILISLTLLFNILVFSMFQALIFLGINFERGTMQINTLQQLAEKKDFSLMTYREFYNIIRSFDDSSVVGEKIKNQLILNMNTVNEDILKAIATNKLPSTVGVLMPRHEALYFQILDSKTGENAIHIMNEPILSMINAFHVPNYSPFLEVMDEMSKRIFESGLRARGWIDTNHRMYCRKIELIKKMGGLVETRPTPMNFDNLRNIFLMYCQFVLVALVVFIGEVIFYLLKSKS